jgi:recombination protein RecA
MQEAIDKINKDFGAGSIMRLGEKPMRDMTCISTGSMGLNLALGIGGLPRGRITEIYGPESSGKTTVALHIIAEAQKCGGVCAFIDVEHAFDETYAKSIGVNIDNLHLSQPDYGEQALEEADRLINSGGLAVVIIDSVAALVPKGELEGEMGDSKMGLQARLMSQACRKLTATISKTNTVCIFINQLRATIGQMYQQEVTTGGNALKFYASIRLDVRKIAQIKDGEEPIGNRVKVKVVKNKVAPPFKTAEFEIMFGKGIDRYGEIVEMASNLEIIKKAGAWYSYNESKLGQGKASAIQMLIDHPAMAIEITKKVKEAIEL